MGRERKFKLKYVLIILVCLATDFIYAALTIKFTVVKGACPANGSITINAMGTSGMVYYTIKKTTDPVYSPQQESNVFPNLTSGSYLVTVYDQADEGPCGI